MWADTVRLSQVFSNLLTNAAKYTAQRGAIEAVLECSGRSTLSAFATMASALRQICLRIFLKRPCVACVCVVADAATSILAIFALGGRWVEWLP